MTDALSLLRDNTFFSPLSLCSFSPPQTKLSLTMTSSPYTLTATQVLELLKNNAITVEAYPRSLLDRTKENDGTIKACAHLGKLLLSLLCGQC